MKKLARIICPIGLIVFCLMLSPAVAQERVLDETSVTPWTDISMKSDEGFRNSSRQEDADESRRAANSLGRWERFMSILILILEGEGISDETIDEDNADRARPKQVSVGVDAKRLDRKTPLPFSTLIKNMTRDQAFSFNRALNTALNSGFKIGYEANITLLEKIVEDDLGIKEINMLARALEKSA